MFKTSKVLMVVFTIVSFMSLSGCTDWHKKYMGLEVEHQNLQGRYQNCVGSLDANNLQKSQMASRLQQYEMTVAELQKQIAEQKSAAKASGFGDNYDVDYDAQKGTLTVTLPNAILFSPGKASLKSVKNADLDYITKVLKSKYQGKMIDIVGNTDSDPIKKSKWKDNWQLSSERALAVLRYLNKKGIKANLIRAVACGSARPIDSNSTAAGKSRNRRVEIVVHMK